MLRGLLAIPFICSTDVMRFSKQIPLENKLLNSHIYPSGQKGITAFCSFCSVSCTALFLFVPVPDIQLGSGRSGRKEGHCVLWNLSHSLLLAGSLFFFSPLQHLLAAPLGTSAQAPFVQAQLCATPRPEQRKRMPNFFFPLVRLTLGVNLFPVLFLFQVCAGWKY